MATLSFEPLVPVALWLTLAIGGGLLLAWYGLRRPGGVPLRRWLLIMGLMAIGLAVVLIVLLNPTWIEPVAPPAGKPLLTLAIDVSASMTTADGSGGQARFQDALRTAKACAKELEQRFEVRVLTFADSVSAADLADLESRRPQGPLTDLASALTASIEENRPQGQAVVLLSDGIHNAEGGPGRVFDAVRIARAMACPIYTQTLGSETEVKDLAVELRSPQELAFQKQKVPAAVRVRQRGLAGARASLALVYEGKELERQQVPTTGDGVAEVRFNVGQDKPGLYRYEVRAEPVPGEVTLINNTATLVLRVVDKPVRVLLLEGKPYWDGKFLMRTLMLDPSVELDGIVRLSENRFLRRTLSRTGEGVKPGEAVRDDWKILETLSDLSSQADLLRSYQIVVLGRDADVFLNEAMLARLRNWIARDGGCLVCYRGQPTAQVNQRLSALLPVKWSPVRESRFRFNLTERGRETNWIAAGLPERLPTLATVARPEQPRPLAVVLATSAAGGAESDTPAVAYQPYGAGRVVVLEGSGMWRWAFLPPQQQRQDSDDVYRSLWHGLLRWLVSSADLLPGQTLALRSDKVSFSTQEQAAATLLMREEAVKGQPPAVQLSGGRLTEPQTFNPASLGDEPGAYRIVFGKLPEGRYRARVAGPAGDDPAGSTAFDVRSFLEEQLDLKARPDLMARIARESGGAVLESGSGESVVEQVRQHLDRDRTPRIRRISAWDRWWVLLGVFALWGMAWGLRRSSGLV